ncbi:amino acid adenylation domain-containing protein [Nonomuraea sp. NN258]|uniref:non-ribosomal peptide synthetase n=1 Tax=Nonomuraea antri TaxID=2730852 RepID=UPI0015692B65|nr:non-ribosomal peptide synthetase [Nonomuraea antri]NRQ35525.1 amino acid adenylation domain-containing protein [Nonomuraea antri]
MIIDAYPLSALQAGMLYHSELDGVTFHDHTTLSLRGTFDEAALVRALDELSARHEVLRTSFDLTGFSEPVQLVHDRAEIPLTVSDGEPEYGPFDWTRAPLLRVHVRPEADRFALTVYFHHAILDGWSVARLVSELLARYAAPGLPLEPPGARFRDLVAAEKAILGRPEAAEFWREAIAEAPEGRLPRRPGYPTGGPRRVEVLATALPGDLARALAEEAAAARVPLRSVLLAAHAQVMALLTGEQDVLTGMLTHSRPESEAGDEVLGLFLNTVPLRVRADAPDLVQRVFEAEVAALPYRHYPLFEIQRLSGRARLLDTHVDFRDFQVRGDAATPIEGQDFFEQTDFAFSAAFVRTPGQGLTLTISYDVTQFPADQIAGIRDHYLRALSGDVSISPQDTALLARWNATEREHPGGTLHELIFAQAERTPDATAVVFDGDRLTYRELAARARQVAAGLGDRLDQPVGVSMERSLDLPVVLLGVLAAGGAYLPLDPADPEERRRGMLEDAGAELVLTEAKPGGDFTARPVHEDNLAYVIFTSGSTGRPKGVGVSHRAIVNRLRWMQNTFHLTDQDRVLHKTPTTFDVSVWELFWPLITGATLVIARPDGHRDTAYLRDLIKAEQITTVHFVPSMLQAFLEEEAIQPPKRIICSGEALPPGIDLPGLHNLYGPTEAAVDVSWHPCQPGEPNVPIGKPVDNTTLHVLDQHLQPVPIGTPGELYIGGVQLARGYLGKPALTAERFLPFSNGQRLYKTGDLARWLPTGELEYLGRTDHQVKIRGMRVELGEIETVLRRQPGVRDAAVAAHDHSLVGYLVGDGGVPELGDVLPDHLIPRRWVHLDALPLTRSGKLDRAALPVPETAGSRPYVPPRDEVEARLARLYEEVLQVPAAGVLDDFFELGGHSLSALRLAARVRQELGRSLPVGTVLSAPTIGALARVLRQPDDLAPPSHVVPLNPDGDRPPIFFVHALGGQVFRYHPLARRLGPDQPVYAIAARGLVPGEQPHATLAEMADAYVADLLEVRPSGPYVLGGFCIGGNIALEVARRLRERGERVPLVVLFYANAEEPVAGASLEDDTVLLFHALAGSPDETLGLDAAELAAQAPEERLLAVMGAASAADRLAPDTAEVEQARRYLAVFRANAHAVGGFRHEPYDGDVALFAPRPEDGGWPSVAKGRFAHVPIPEERVPILYEPLVADAATEIRRWMDHGIPDQ